MASADTAGRAGSVERLVISRPRPLRHIGRYVTLEPLCAEHISELFVLAREQPESWRWMPFGPFAEAGAFAVYARLMMSSREEMVWCVRPHDTHGNPGGAAGWLALLDMQPANAAIELGNIWFPSPLARSRAATEAMALLLSGVFDQLGYRRVTWKCNALNRASWCAARRLGFKPEGILRAHMIVKGERRDSAYFSMLAEEWPERRTALSAWLDPENFDANTQQHHRLRRHR